MRALMVIASTNLGIILVEFDSLKGPVIRKKTSKLSLDEKTIGESVLMWIIRANEFSVKKIGNQTAYAKAVTFTDPNFIRKKRQFGIAILSKPTIDLTEAEIILDIIIERSRKICENQPYFKILNGLLYTITNFKLPEKFEEKTVRREPEEVKSKNENEQEIPTLLISSRLNLFQKIVVTQIESKNQLVIGTTNAFNKHENPNQQKQNYRTEKIAIEVIFQRNAPESIDIGMDILMKILDVIPDITNKENRIQASIEFLDRLLLEEVDIQYYMPFSQYLIAMESFTISEFKNEEFIQQLDSLKETHGKWIECLGEKELDGKKLTDFFGVTDIKRESLELLIDLLFVKLIAIF